MRLCGRSTKAGSLSPATLGFFGVVRRTDDGRSTKAGSLSPATRGRGRRRPPSRLPLNEGRELIPGDTRCGGTRSSSTRSTLNEGRELIPGDTPPFRLRFRRGAWRSTKAGSLSPATQRVLGQSVVLAGRSTKAGSLSPATPAPPPRSERPRCRPLNEGRELIPGDTRSASRAPTGTNALNEGRELIPGDTRPRAATAAAADAAQRRPGAYPRRHAWRTCWSAAPTTTLNEGRELIPGDTHLVGHRRVAPVNRSTKAGSLSPATPASSLSSLLIAWSAQRRPGAYPPATPAASRGIPYACSTAQRRPGAYPRRHAALVDSTAMTPSAQRRPGAYPRRHPGASRRGIPRGAALNEGRELIPGDTGAGRRRWRAPARPLNEGRELIPGDTWALAAQLLAPVDRSTKAGSLSPATRPRSVRWPRHGGALNEGRELIPGDTVASIACNGETLCAQRRPGAYPRRHSKRKRGYPHVNAKQKCPLLCKAEMSPCPA